ncbi:MAG: hypothetical protein ACUVUC_05435 [Thermoguttaceae bacterium]
MGTFKPDRPGLSRPQGCSCCGNSEGLPVAISRRGFLGGVGTAALAGAAWTAAAPAAAPKVLTQGNPLRVKPVLLFSIPRRAELTSWRPYGGIESPEHVDQELGRIAGELKQLAKAAEFRLKILPLARASSDAEVAAVAAAEADALLVYASGGPQHWLERLAASGKPNLMFLRHKSGPFYLWYEIAHWRFLRKNEDLLAEPNMDTDDIVVDDYGEVLWRLRALYGLTSTMGTRVLAIGGLQAYSAPGQQLGPPHAEKVWKFSFKTISHDELEKRLAQARSDQEVLQQVQRQTDELLGQKGITLQTDRNSVVHTFLALRVFKDLMHEAGASNLGVAHCMGGLIPILQTPPCLILSLLNDEGYTAFCHVDMTHTVPGVLLRHISGKPSFVSNSHYPHHGLMTLAHCSSPRKMNGKDYEPTRIMTHFESDFGAATKVQYTKGQIVTTLFPNLRCTKWFGLRGKILDTPSYPACRSQIELQIDGDWRRLLRHMQGFHTVTCYGDYLREVGYVLKKVQIEWENVSEAA